MALRPCYLSHVLLDEQSDQQAIFVAERVGKRRFPIVIGPFEALAIDRPIKGAQFPRPLTHDLIVNLITAARLRCREIRIVDLREGTFFAEVLLADDQGRELTLDCRPSDAIALLVRLPGTPLTVAEQVLAEAGG